MWWFEIRLVEVQSNKTENLYIFIKAVQKVKVDHMLLSKYEIGLGNVQPENYPLNSYHSSAFGMASGCGGIVDLGVVNLEFSNLSDNGALTLENFFS